MKKKELAFLNSSKIIDVKKFLNIKKKNKSKKFIMCHGVFDVVHPGHLRHLIYAKSKADFLIVSLTSDRHITKDTYRPHVPEKIRAINLAAFEIVDFVIIDNQPTPINNILKIKPNFFAKGFEYDRKKVTSATLDEIKALETFGGQMIYTPGDIIYSSSNFLSNSLPKLKIEKLLDLMQQDKITFDQLRNTIKKFKKLKIHVVGDTIVDTYTEGSFIGGQTKTPTISILYQNHKNYVGGAGIVAKHLSSAGSKVTFTTVLGDDELKDFVLKDLKKSKVLINSIIDKSRPTVNKNAIISSGYRLLKIDKVDNRSINQDILNKIINYIKKSSSEGIILTDFRHGIFNKLTIDKIISSIPKKLFKAADSQVASRWGNITQFKKFDLITPNEREARFALADQDSTVGALASSLFKETGFKNLILKLGDKGIFCSTKNKNQKPYFALESFVENLIDPVGAGDALMAYATLSLMLKEKLSVAAILGSLAAAIECESDGNNPVYSETVLNKIDDLEKEIKFI